MLAVKGRSGGHVPQLSLPNRGPRATCVAKSSHLLVAPRGVHRRCFFHKNTSRSVINASVTPRCQLRAASNGNMTPLLFIPSTLAFCFHLFKISRSSTASQLLSHLAASPQTFFPVSGHPFVSAALVFLGWEIFWGWRPWQLC